MHVSNLRTWHPVGDRTDKPGRILVRIILADPKGGNQKGNLTRTFSCHGATVTEIATIARNACQVVADKVKVSMDAEREPEEWESYNEEFEA